MWPIAGRPTFGIFVKQQVESLRERAGVDAESFPLQPVGSRRRYLSGRSVARAISRGAFDVVHCHHPFSLLALAPHVGQLSAPIVLTIHGIEGMEGWRRQITRRVVRLADEVIVTNRALQARYGGHLLPCGVDPSIFRPRPDRPDGTPVSVITVGEDRPEKQFWLAEAAVAFARRAHVPAFTHRFVSGVHPDGVPARYRSAQILLVSSRAEGSPMVIQEALASRLRIVSTDVGDLRHSAGSGQGIYVARDQSPGALGERLIAALRDEDGRRDFEPSFISAADVASRLQSLYSTLAASRGARRR
jgi:glycosyltransferase involved in cell wall biosynthesis